MTDGVRNLLLSSASTLFRIHFLFIKKQYYSVTNSTGATQRFSTNNKTSSEQKNRSSFISDQSRMRDLRRKVYFHQRKGNQIFTGERHDVGRPRVRSLHCKGKCENKLSAHFFKAIVTTPFSCWGLGVGNCCSYKMAADFNGWL